MGALPELVKDVGPILGLVSFELLGVEPLEPD